MDTNAIEEVLIACGVTVAVAIKRSRRPKSKWCKEWLLEKDKFSNETLLRELAENEAISLYHHFAYVCILFTFCVPQTHMC